LFRLHPEPAVHRWVSVEVDDPAAAHDAVQSVVHAQVVPAAVEVDQPIDGSGTVTVLLSGKAEGVEGRVRTTRQLLGEHAEVAEQAPAGWSSYPWQPGETGLKLTCVLSGLRDVLRTARAVGASVRGSGGTGVLYAAVADAGRAAEAVERLRAICARHQGAAVVVDGPREVKEAVDVWGPVPALDLMQRVKNQFDPDHRLAPGRFVGGI
jgi:glycolate oxidase FAD binding subunit